MLFQDHCAIQGSSLRKAKATEQQNSLCAASQTQQRRRALSRKPSQHAAVAQSLKVAREIQIIPAIADNLGCHLVLLPHELVVAAAASAAFLHNPAFIPLSISLPVQIKKIVHRPNSTTSLKTHQPHPTGKQPRCSRISSSRIKQIISIPRLRSAPTPATTRRCSWTGQQKCDSQAPTSHLRKRTGYNQSFSLRDSGI